LKEVEQGAQDAQDTIYNEKGYRPDSKEIAFIIYKSDLLKINIDGEALALKVKCFKEFYDENLDLSIPCQLIGNWRDIDIFVKPDSDDFIVTSITGINTHQTSNYTFHDL
jgi:hypothetical protein